MKKRILALVLAALLTAPSLLSCSESTENAETKETTPTAAAEEVAEVVEEETEMTRADVKDDLPELDYGGQTITILARDKAWFTGEMLVEELNGEALNDAVYDRDVYVEDRLKCVIDYSLQADTNGMINKNVTSGSDEFGLHVGSAVDTVQYGINGNYYNLLGEYPEYLNLDQPWWSQYYTQQGSACNKVFFATGDLCFSLMKLAFVTYVNLQMIQDLGLPSPYDFVRDGTWTFDKEMEMAETARLDKNGDGSLNQKKDEGDVYGMSIGGQIGCDVYWSAFDLTICSKDENDVPSFNVDADKMSSVIDKLFHYYLDCDWVFTPVNNSDAEQDDIAKMLSEDRMLFSPLRVMHTEQLREMESDYGLMPLPKWDEAQNGYYTFVHDQYSIVGIPISVQDPSFASAVMEAMAAQSYRYVTPAYYDLALNGKYLRDMDSSEMLEIAMAGIKIDFGWIHTYSLASCSQALLRDIIYQKTSASSFASDFAKKQKAYNKSMEKFVEKVEKIDH